MKTREDVINSIIASDLSNIDEVISWCSKNEKRRKKRMIKFYNLHKIKLFNELSQRSDSYLIRLFTKKTNCAIKLFAPGLFFYSDDIQYYSCQNI